MRRADLAADQRKLMSTPTESSAEISGSRILEVQRWRETDRFVVGITGNVSVAVNLSREEAIKLRDFLTSHIEEPTEVPA